MCVDLWFVAEKVLAPKNMQLLHQSEDERVKEGHGEKEKSTKYPIFYPISAIERHHIVESISGLGKRMENGLTCSK